jgi:hypothetical protein
VQNGRSSSGEIVGAAIVDRAKERLITPRNCGTPESRARVVHGLNAIMSRASEFGSIAYEARLRFNDIDAVIERWTREVMRRSTCPTVLKNTLKRFLIEKTLEAHMVKT